MTAAQRGRQGVRSTGTGVVAGSIHHVDTKGLTCILCKSIQCSTSAAPLILFKGGIGYSNLTFFFVEVMQDYFCDA